MNCQKIKAHLTAFHHGEVNSEEEKEIRSHLLMCSACRFEYEEIESFSDQLSQANWEEDISVDPQYFRRLVKKASEDREVPSEIRESFLNYLRPSRSGNRIWWAVAAVVLLSISLFPFAPLKPLVPLVFDDSGKEKRKEREREKNNPKAEYVRFVTLVDPEDPQAQYKLALWCKEKQLLAEAKKHIKKVIHLEPANPRARRLLEEFKM